jgi:hypothetical protein
MKPAMLTQSLFGRSHEDVDVEPALNGCPKAVGVCT